MRVFTWDLDCNFQRRRFGQRLRIRQLIREEVHVGGDRERGVVMPGEDLDLLRVPATEEAMRDRGMPERVPCQVRFTQYAGGEVVNVEFLSCPYDAQARESVERALMKTPMPYAGFETVFQRNVILTMCYPREECER